MGIATNNSKQDHFLFIAYLNSHLSQLFRLIEFVRNYKLGTSTLLFDGKYDVVDDVYIKKAKHYALNIINPDGSTYVAPSSGRNRTQSLPDTPRKGRMDSVTAVIKEKAWVLNAFRHLLSCVNVFVYTAEFLKKTTQARSILRALRPDIIILPEENIVSETTLYTKTGRNLGIPAVVFPYTMADPSEFYETYYDAVLLQKTNIFNRIVGRLFPKWVYLANGRWLLLLPWPRIIALELLRLSPPVPWMINSGFSIIATESKAMEQFYLQYGLSKDQLTTVGSLSDDLLFQQSRTYDLEKEKLYTKYHLDRTKSLLLCSQFPPREIPEKSDFSTYSEMVNFWIQSIAKVKNYNVIVNLHPRVKHENMKHIEEYGIKIVNENIVELIPLCDLYLANISATIRWAIACGKPVLNCDFYKFRCHHYDAAAGVVTVETRKEFLDQLWNITENATYYSSLKKNQEACRQDWGMLDGKSGDRIKALFNKLLHSAQYDNGYR